MGSCTVITLPRLNLLFGEPAVSFVMRAPDTMRIASVRDAEGNQPRTMEEELVIASLSIDDGIRCWVLQTGVEQLCFKSCTSAPHGLAPVGHRFLASSQLRDSKASSGFILYCSWTKPQVEVKSFPEEPIKLLVADSEGTYIVGGGHPAIFICGRIFYDYQNQQASHQCEHNFQEHTLRVTDLVTGHGGGNAIIVSASEDRTCKVWSLSKEKLLRNIVFPSVIDAIVLDPREHVFYAGGRDGKIYIASLTGDGSSYKNQFPHIVSSLSSQRNGCRTDLHFPIARPVNNVCVVRPPVYLMAFNVQGSLRRHGSSLPPPLSKHINSTEDAGKDAVVAPRAASDNPLDAAYLSSQVIDTQIKELQKQGSSAAADMEMEKLKLENAQLMQMGHKWRKMFDNLYELCVNELLEGENTRSTNHNLN